MTARAIIVGSASSGAGKTTLTAGLLRAIRRRGTAVRGAKSGPDYIDPAFHQAATGAPSFNLDSWAMPPPLLDAMITEAAGPAEYLVIEGAMGLFDGGPGQAGRTGAAADLARRYGLPTLLVLDITGQSQTAAAIVRGLAAHDPDVRVAGVVLNRVASERHRAYAADAIAALGIPVFGAVPRDEKLGRLSRHLGLVQAQEHPDIDAWLDRLADTIEKHVDLDRLLSAFTSFAASSSETDVCLPPPGGRIALASDRAFAFIYPHLVSGWRKAGAEIVPFSPLADQAPPEDCDCCWLPGGYPELHAGELAGAHRFRDGLRRFAAKSPVYGECGGYMVLGEGLEDAEGRRHQMVGLLGHSTSFSRRKLTLGYRRGCLRAGSPVGAAGDCILGHEFHYSIALDEGRDDPLFELFDARGSALGPAGGRRGQVSGAYFHAIAKE